MIFFEPSSRFSSYLSMICSENRFTLFGIMLYRSAMGRVLKCFWAVWVLCAANIPAFAHEMLANAEAGALSEADRRVAAKAERDALDRDEVIRSFPWVGPDGASGLIIVSGQFPDFYGLGRCRNLIHIIRHPGDGGVNPTFEAKVCRDWEGRWSVEER